MAIKFGDVLENQNANYPIVDASTNNVKGVIFHTGLPSETDFPNKRALGTILVDTTTKTAYLYQGANTTNAVWGNADNWVEIGAGESIQTEAIPVAIGTGNSFGRYQNGDEIPVGEGKTALQIIIDALTAYQAPIGSFTGAEYAVPYRTTSQSIAHTVTFSVTNRNQQVVSGTNFAISEIRLLRRLGTGSYTLVASATSSNNQFTTGTFSALNTAGAPTPVTFTFNDTVTVASGSSDFNYKLEIVPLNGSGQVESTVSVTGLDNTSGYIDCASYSPPTLNSDSHERADVSTHFVGTAESNTTREKGNIATKLIFRVRCNSSAVPITSFAVKRSINGGAAVTIYTVSGLNVGGLSTEYKVFDSIAVSANNITGLDNTPTGYTNVTSAFPAGSTNADTIEYSITITDGEQNSNDAFNTGVINLEFPGLVGYSTVDGSAFTVADNGSMTSVLHAIRDSSSLKAQYEIINTSGIGDPDFGSVALSTTATQFVYIAFPATYNVIDTIQVPGSPSEFGAFNSAPKSITVPYTTHYGVTSSAYEVYCSNSAGAFSNTYNIN